MDAFTPELFAELKTYALFDLPVEAFLVDAEHNAITGRKDVSLQYEDGRLFIDNTPEWLMEESCFVQGVAICVPKSDRWIVIPFMGGMAVRAGDTAQADTCTIDSGGAL